MVRQRNVYDKASIIMSLYLRKKNETLLNVIVMWVFFILKRERRIIYVGKIPNNYTKRKLRKRFECFGEIEEASVHFRESG